MSENNDHPVDLFRRALEFDQEAFDKLKALQCSGRALRIYPDGRRGVDDPGRAVVLISVRPDGLAKFQSSQGNQFDIGVENFAFDADLIVAHTMQQVMEDKEDRVLNMRSECSMEIRTRKEPFGHFIVCSMYPADADYWLVTPVSIAVMCHAVTRAIEVFNIPMDEAYDSAPEWRTVRELSGLINYTFFGEDDDC